MFGFTIKYILRRITTGILEAYEAYAEAETAEDAQALIIREAIYDGRMEFVSFISIVNEGEAIVPIEMTYDHKYLGQVEEDV